jgi:hypothetical protein
MEVFASLLSVVEGLEDVFAVFQELTGDVEAEASGGFMCCRCKLRQLCSLLKKGMVRVLTRMNCQIIYCVTAGKLQMATSDVEYLMSQRQDQAESNQLEDVGQMTKRVTDQVQQDLTEVSQCCSAPKLAWYLFSKRCTLIAVMRYSLFISSTMSTLLFICDLATATALAALFFQTSGGAVAQDADDRCKPADIYESIGQIIAIGVVTIIFGMLPSTIISKLHNRDFVTEATLEECQRQLRLWKHQDRFIVFAILVIITFCLFFDLVFIANVTPQDGEKWCMSCLTSIVKTLFLVPLVMIVPMLGMLLAFTTSKEVHKEVHLLCSADPISKEQSRFHRQLCSPWASAVHRRKVRLMARRVADSNAKQEATIQGNFTCPEAIPEATFQCNFICPEAMAQADFICPECKQIVSADVVHFHL